MREYCPYKEEQGGLIPADGQTLWCEHFQGKRKRGSHECWGEEEGRGEA